MRALCLSLSGLFLLSLSNAIAADPSVGIIQPRGGQRGTECVVLFNGNNLSDAQEVVFYSPGFTVTKLEAVSNTQTKVTLKIAPDARLGQHACRLRTATGISEMRTYWVGALPVVDEKEPNSEFTTPQKIALNTTVHGVSDNEDVDYYAVDAKKGQRISVEIEGIRLGGAIYDPYIAILDSKRFELATSDDSALLRQDGCLSILAPADGTYYVQVRETSYGGNGSSQYRLHVGTFPRPLAIVPAGGKLGEEVEVRFLGDASGEIRQKIKLPATMPEGKFGLHCEDAGGISPAPIPFRLTDSAVNVNEVEPNDTHAQATPGVFPCAFNGVIDKPGDIDHFKFAGKKGQVLDVHCYARRLGSPLDPVMGIALNGQGNFAANDDSGGPDSYFRVTLPQDGEYVISVTDHLKKGGVNYFYRVEMTTVAPSLQLSVPSFQQFTQARQAYAVPRGNRFATLVAAARVDFGGDLNIVPEGLPAKVAVATDLMPANMSVVPMVFEAAPDAPLATGRMVYRGVPVDPNLKIKSSFEQKAEGLIGNPGNYPYWVHSEYQAIMAVTEAAPFKISIVEPKVPLVHGGSMQLKIVAERAPGFKAPITITPLYNPPGIGSASSVTIPEGQNEVLFPLNANGGAPIRKWKYAVHGTATVGNGAVWVSSQLATLEIAAPYMAFVLERGAVEQGKQTQMFVKITNNKPFPGTAKVRLIGLPPKVTVTELDINKDAKEVAFSLSLEPTAPVGIHRNLFCQVIVMENGEPIVHSLGSSELRVDAPLPPKPNQPAVVVAPKVNPTPMPMVPTAAPVKRLTRLEQLRLEQEEREKAAKAGTATPAPTPAPAPAPAPKKN